jgi:hypothetical protein
MNIIESDPITLTSVNSSTTHTNTYWPTLDLTPQEVRNILDCAYFVDRLAEGEITLGAEHE